MVQLSVIEAQLHKLGAKRTFFSAPEIRELCHILLDHEKIAKYVNGRYNGGFAILVATQLRLLLIDKKPLYLTVEDVRYDMISEIDMGTRVFDAYAIIFTVNKKLIFNSIKQKKLRDLTSYVQQRVMEMRTYNQDPSFSHRMPAPNEALQPTPVRQTSYQVNNNLQPAHNPVQGILAHTREHIPGHIPQAVGNAATKLASRLHHNPNPYTKEPLLMRKQWSSWSEPTIAPTYEPEA